MKTRVIALALAVLFLQSVFAQPIAIEKAATKFVPGVTWRPKSVVAADFTCQGRKQSAILGTTSTDIVIGVFLNGFSLRPEVLRYSARVRRADSATLTLEDLNYDPKEELGYQLPGFRRSTTCKGLNLDDGETDLVHIYWNHVAHRFDDWSR